MLTTLQIEVGCFHRRKQERLNSKLAIAAFKVLVQYNIFPRILHVKDTT